MLKPIDDERKELEYIKSENARKINNKIYKLKSKNLIYGGMLSDTYHTFDSFYTEYFAKQIREIDEELEENDGKKNNL